MLAMDMMLEALVQNCPNRRMSEELHSMFQVWQAVAKSGVSGRDANVPSAVTQTLLAREGPAKDPAPAALFFLPRGQDPRAPAGAAEAPRASTSRFSLCRLCSTSSAPRRCMSVREPCVGFYR